MKKIIVVTLFIMMAPITQLNAALNKDKRNVAVHRISERVAIANFYEFADIAAIKTEKGIVVFDNVWCTAAGKAYREAFEKEFGSNEFIYLVDIVDDLINLGGAAAYPGVKLIAHQELANSIKLKRAGLETKLKQRADVFFNKVKQSEKQMASLEPESKDYKNWKSWRDLCQILADDLSGDYELVEPQITFTDNLTLHMGDVTLNLIYFGASDFRGSLIVLVPEEEILIVGASFHSMHLSPTLETWESGFDVERWLSLLKEILESDVKYKNVITSYASVLPISLLEGRYLYMKKMWEGVQEAIEEGKDFEAFANENTLDGTYSFIKTWPIYINNGEEWVKREHKRTMERFWEQCLKNSANNLKK